jgi:hypothetical protein
MESVPHQSVTVFYPTPVPFLAFGFGSIFNVTLDLVLNLNNPNIPAGRQISIPPCSPPNWKPYSSAGGAFPRIFPTVIDSRYNGV